MVDNVGAEVKLEMSITKYRSPWCASGMVLLMCSLEFVIDTAG